MLYYIYNHKARLIFVVVFGVCLVPGLPPPLALITGFLLTYYLGNPFGRSIHSLSQVLLKFSVIGLGFGMDVHAVLKTTHEGLTLTMLSIGLTLILGFLVGGILHLTQKTSHLVASGTAICGGSAIAAIAPVVNASEREVSVALGTVFLFNSIALIVFPVIGHLLHLSQHQFGMWAAIAIHDTSSVVSAANSYGTEALQVATTVKLARSLWIIPVALLSSLVFHNSGKKISIPWFIGVFIAAMLIHSYFPQMHSYATFVNTTAKAGLTAALFLIGSSISLNDIKQIGWKPLTLGMILWLVISIVSLLFILFQR